MELKPYFFGLSVEARKELAGRCGTTLAHLKNVAYGDKNCGVQLAVALERETNRSVTRQELREDWADIWPELSKRRRSKDNEPA